MHSRQSAATGTRMNAETSWFLEGYLGEERVLRRFAVHERHGLCVGRRGTLELCIPDHTVSALHAEFYVRDDGLHLRDLGSSNGTYLNRERVFGEVAVREGDAVHFCRNEFRVGRAHSAGAMEEAERTTRTAVSAMALPGQLCGGREMHELLQQQSVCLAYQPIRALDDSGGSDAIAYELLGRGNHPRLPHSPVDLFQIAESIGVATHLSGLFRDIGVLKARQLPGDPNIFFNTHPAELNHPQMLDDLRRLRRSCPDLVLTMEIHEAVAASSSAMGKLRERLRDMDIGLAYDDFGAGQGRLVLLADTPPDYLKFDISLVHGIDRASSSRQRLLTGLVDSVRSMGVRCIAEGVETEAELQICREMGFDLAQGYHLGRPAPLECWLRTDTTPLQPRSASARRPTAHINETTVLPRDMVLDSA